MKALIILLLLSSCGKDHNGVGQLRVKYKCNANGTWKIITKTVYNPEKYCNREFNKLMKELAKKCGGTTWIDEEFCGVAQ